ncbi:MAG: ATP-binding protein, partial [Anaerolineae bacterium]|nr:ATP-binding protein [Anaerolineae bacterium]
MMDPAQIEANITLEQTRRRASLLAAAAEVSQNITQLLDIDELLPKTVDIICEAYDFYYAGVFLIDDVGEFAVLKAGRGEPGQIMMENNHKLAVGGNSMIGACTAFNEARISLDVDTEKVWYPNPVLPETRSEMALPLTIGDRVIGAVTVQSVESAAFSDEDVSSLQAMANQLAIAIDNARQRRELEETHAELLHAKTFEAIATATGDAIHWIGNKAEPIGGAIKRAEEDIQIMVAATAKMFSQENLPAEVKNQPFVQHLLNEANVLVNSNPKLPQLINRILNLPADKLKMRLSVPSILEDLQITAEAGQMIMKIKEDLIGPAREQAPRPVMLDDVVKDAISGLGVPPRVINLTIENDLSLVQADSVQLNRVFVNLIENAYEAMGQQPKPQINMTIYPDRDKEYMMVDVTDNGSGIAEEDIDKIWITFHTTKGLKGGTGLGLPACRLILEQMGGHISATSQLGKGSTFTVSVPIYKAKEPISREEPARGKIL